MGSGFIDFACIPTSVKTEWVERVLLVVAQLLQQRRSDFVSNAICGTAVFTVTRGTSLKCGPYKIRVFIYRQKDHFHRRATAIDLGGCSDAAHYGHRNIDNPNIRMYFAYCVNKSS